MIKRERYFDFLAALLICANPLAWIAPMSSGALPIICVIILSLYFFGCIIFKVPPLSFVTTLMTIVILLFFITDLIVDGNNAFLRDYLLGFLSLCIIGFQLGWMRHDIKRVIAYVAIFGILLLPFILTMDMGGLGSDMNADYGHWMGISYGLLRLICAIIVLLFMYNNSRKNACILFGVLFLYAIFFLNYASRGAILAIIICFLLLYLINVGEVSSKLFIIVSVFAILSFIVVNNFEEFIVWLAEQLENVGIRPFFLNKMISMINHGISLDSGRDYIAQVAWSGIYKSPILGNGIGAFEGPNNGYTHNVFLQVFFEMGVFPYLYLCITSAVSFYTCINKQVTKEQKIWMVYLISAGLIELLFSSTLWRSQIFWMLLGNTSYLMFNQRRRLCQKSG